MKQQLILAFRDLTHINIQYMLYIGQKDSDLKTAVRPASDNLQISVGEALAEPISNIVKYSQSVYLIHPK